VKQSTTGQNLAPASSLVVRLGQLYVQYIM